jgi:ubiquinone/menaquinone biosynthesis C-methylase UbiE
MIDHATRRAAQRPNLGFIRVEGPRLPFADASFDVVTSFLSFRYLDWDPILSEVRRVLAPGGRMLIVDMVEKTPTLRDTPQLLRSFGRHVLRHVRDRRFVRDLTRLTAEPAWQEMVRHNPIRAVHEYRWYLESRFPGQKLATLNVSRRARLVAFDTGALGAGSNLPMSYP